MPVIKGSKKRFKLFTWNVETNTNNYYRTIIVLNSDEIMTKNTDIEINANNY